MYLRFILAFMILVGAALLCAHLLKLRIGEGMVPAVASLVFVMYLSGTMHVFKAGIVAFGICGAAGWAMHIWMSAVRRAVPGSAGRQSHAAVGSTEVGQTEAGQTAAGQPYLVRSPYLVISFLLLLFFMAAYYNDFIQRIDELHLWAPNIRYMLQQNALPVGENSYDSFQKFGTSLFHVYFQYFSGYSEALMYVSGSMLAFLGMLLPLGALDNRLPFSKRLSLYGKAALYALLMWFASYVLYLYGIKSLYVDIPVLGWAAGLAGWWISREKGRKSNLIVLLSGLLLVNSLKTMVGALLALFVLIWVLLWTLFGEGSYQRMTEKQKKTLQKAFVCVVILALIAAALCIALPSLRNRIFYGKESAQFGKTKLKQVLSAYLTAIFGQPLSGSKIAVNAVAGWLLCAGLFVIAADLAGRKRIKTVGLGYSVLVTGGYAAVLLYAYCCIFSYEESVQVAGIRRYLTILIMYLMILAVTFLMLLWCQIPIHAAAGAAYSAEISAGAAAGSESSIEVSAGAAAGSKSSTEVSAGSTAGSERSSEISAGAAARPQGSAAVSGQQRGRAAQKTGYVLLGFTIFFALGLNNKFIPSMTGLNKAEISNYEELSASHSQIKKIKKIIGEEDKVFLLNQKGETEYPVNMAYYHLEGQINNYLVEPWCFTENGCKIRVRETNEYTLADFADMLVEGTYTYVWIYTADTYLKENLPETMSVDGTIKDASLYHVEIDETGKVSLALVKRL